jgi:hypothetical protein
MVREKMKFAIREARPKDLADGEIVNTLTLCEAVGP